MTSIKVSPVLKLGNLKIGVDTLIFNEGTALECPSKKLGLCDFCNVMKGYNKKSGESLCYGAKMEWGSKVLAYRKKQEKYWLNTSAQNIVNDFKGVVRAQSYNGLDISYLRVNEVHDLKSYETTLKWFEIAQSIPELTLYTYTRRKDIVEKLKEVPDNFIINTSNFKIDGFNSFQVFYDDNDETKPDTVLRESQLPKNAMICPGKCAKCSLCKVNHGGTTYVKYH